MNSLQCIHQHGLRHAYSAPQISQVELVASLLVISCIIAPLVSLWSYSWEAKPGNLSTAQADVPRKATASFTRKRNTCPTITLQSTTIPQVPDAAKHAQAWKKTVKRTMISELHRKVSRALSAMGLPHDCEVVTEDGLFSVDIMLREQGIIVEVDGPTHYTYNSQQRLGAYVCTAPLGPSSVCWICSC